MYLYSMDIGYVYTRFGWRLKLLRLFRLRQFMTTTSLPEEARSF